MVIGLSGVQFGLLSYKWWQGRTTAQWESDLFITSGIKDRIGRNKVLLPIDHKNFKKGKICIKRRTKEA